MRIQIDDPGLVRICGLLEGEGYRARLVGGAVRDIVAGARPKDKDIATDALPDAVMSVAQAADLRVVPTGLQHGTVTVVIDGEPYEITTLRRDVETDGRHAVVEYVTDFRVDAARRDFTFNAMSASVDGEVHDYFGGLGDLQANRVRFVGNADDRIAEDYLRILRFFRFRARFGGSETAGDMEAVARGRHGLKGISVERIWSEVSRVIVHPRGQEQVVSMQVSGVAAAITMPGDEEQAALAASVAAAGGRPGTVLGVLCGDRHLAAETAARWKLSTSEADDAVAATLVLEDPSGDRLHWIGRATEGLDPARVIPVLEATGRTSAAAGLILPLPVFPLRGQDLLDAGIEPGRQVGTLLAVARQEWKSSGFEASRDDLLARAVPSPSRRP